MHIWFFSKFQTILKHNYLRTLMLKLSKPLYLQLIFPKMYPLCNWEDPTKPLVMLFVVYGEWRNNRSSFLTFSIDFVGLCHRLCTLANLDLFPSRNICNMMTISYTRLGSSIRGKILWQTAYLTWIWVVLWKRNAKIF